MLTQHFPATWVTRVPIWGFIHCNWLLSPLPAERGKAGGMQLCYTNQLTFHTRALCANVKYGFCFFTSFRTAVQPSNISTAKGTWRKKKLCLPCPDSQKIYVQNLSGPLISSCNGRASCRRYAFIFRRSEWGAGSERHRLLTANLLAAKVLSLLHGRAVCPSCLHQRKAKGPSVNGIQEIFNGCLWKQNRSWHEQKFDWSLVRMVNNGRRLSDHKGCYSRTT